MEKSEESVLIATVVDPKGSEFPLDDKYDVNSGADHLLMEARLCNFMWKAFKRSKILHKLQFGCDMHGRQKENAVLGLHFRKDELAYFGVPANNSVLGEEIVRVTSPIPQMFGLKEVSFPPSNELYLKLRGYTRNFERKHMFDKDLTYRQASPLNENTNTRIEMCERQLGKHRLKMEAFFTKQDEIIIFVFRNYKLSACSSAFIASTLLLVDALEKR
ncbi:hypothetical protein X801_03502 [Opisthorchis viverrini]|uniref:Uncharacterized protein n=1 Tax=Opisthorchis viverrini TaxID=6198 RepID=A0A1S8X1M6_OPIVI|nr:hypothetical protein X801_03502 [Opisthorchis viverrini]